jgi:FkbM family methyltransferase
MKIPEFIKAIGRKTIFREGSIRTVISGPCRGLRYKIFPGYGWAYLYGGWERPQVRAMCKLLKPGSVAYDIGANYGMHTLLFARLTGASGRVFAFEPSPEVFAALAYQLELNSIQTVTIVNQAVAEKTGEAQFDIAHHRGAGHLTDVGRGAYKVETTSLDDFVFNRRELPPDFIKIDVEGAESRVLQGAVQVIRQFRPTMMIECHNPAEDRAVGDILAELRYKAFRIADGAPVKDLTSGWPDPQGIWGTVLCVPE